ncbi:MAG TPA: TraI domain-containing protein, partial [Gammaproteobacteria bacterium]|nr:TraI domain-containing protein [Gammaproteobacteria bacterium]
MGLPWFKKEVKLNLSCKKETNENKEWYKGLPAALLLTQSPYEEKLSEIESLISVTPSAYQELYVVPLYAFVNLVQQLPHPTNKGSILEVALDRVIDALKIRRGYMLPVGADTETCYREQDTWTYAVFLAALFQECWLVLGAFNIDIKDIKAKDMSLLQRLGNCLSLVHHYYHYHSTALMEDWKAINPILVKLLLPTRSLNLLANNPELFSVWKESISTTQQEKNPITEILNRAHAPIHAEQNCTPSSEKTEEVTMQKDKNQISDCLIGAIKNAIEKQELLINQPDGFIYRVSEGILLKYP